MKSLLSSMAILWLAVSGASASAANKTVDVSVVESVPADASFVWEAAGDGAVPCTGAACSLYATFADLKSPDSRSGVLKLKFPDGKIVVAECAMESDCAVAANPRRMRAVFAGASGDRVKVFTASRAAAKKRFVTGEVFRVRGVLRPHLHVEMGTVLTKTGLVTGEQATAIEEIASN